MKLPIVIARSFATWQSHSTKIYLFVFFVFFTIFSVFAPLVLATSKTDYEYQYGQYRQSYPEYRLLKADYLSTPSLDNQQKVILSAKQAIMSRDLAKASFALYLIDLINGSEVDYVPVRPIVTALGLSREFFLLEAQKSQSLLTENDLKSYTTGYQRSVVHHDRIIKFGILANKLSALVRIQLNSKSALEILVTKLQATIPATLTARIQELRDSAKIIDGKIDLLAKNLNLIEDEESADSEIFFSSRVEKLIEIQTLQLDWINRLIDVDKNYAQSN